MVSRGTGDFGNAGPAVAAALTDMTKFSDDAMCQLDEERLMDGWRMRQA